MIEFVNLEQQMPADAPWRPLARAMFVKSAWLLKPMLEFLQEKDLPQYLRDLGEIWRVLHAIRPIDQAERINEVIRGLQFHSIEFLRLQLQFAQTGAYKSSDFEKVRQEVYAVGNVMQQYLDGLLLTYVAWPNHYRLLEYYRRAYLQQAPPGRCLEVGPGHGWLAVEQLRSHADNMYQGLDISPHSVAYARSVLQAAGIDRRRYEVTEADAQQSMGEQAEPFDRIVIAEVLEHLERPDELLKAAARSGHDRTQFFITTVVNIEAVDHIYLFRTLDEVRRMHEQCGLRIEDELAMPLRMNLEMPEEAYEVALVCTKSRSGRS